VSGYAKTATGKSGQSSSKTAAALYDYSIAAPREQLTVNWEEIGYPDQLSATVRDLWQDQDLGKFSGSFSG